MNNYTHDCCSLENTFSEKSETDDFFSETNEDCCSEYENINETENCYYELNNYGSDDTICTSHKYSPQNNDSTYITSKLTTNITNPSYPSIISVNNVYDTNDCTIYSLENNTYECCYDSSKITTNNDCNKMAVNMINLFDANITNATNHIQNQINIINTSYMEIINEIKKENECHKQIYNDIEEINNTLINIQNKIVNECKCDHTCNPSSPNKIVYDKPGTEQELIITNDIKFIFVTLVGGGGAGGIGYIDNMHYYSGGGGGSGACIINKPVEVIKGTIIKIYVGNGGSQITNKNGEDTYIKIINNNTIDNYIIIAKGGENGNPKPPLHNGGLNFNYDSITIVEGGHGGYVEYCIGKGVNGENGIISIPSFISTRGGDGGSSLYYRGGHGAGNYFTNGGMGGTLTNLIGESGKYGSGGGGSAPKTIIDYSQRLSGDGGNGIVIIHW